MAAAGMGACAITDRYDAAQIISASDSEVAVLVGTRRNPNPIASEHCATVGRTSVLDSYEVAETTGLGPTAFVYRFRCVDR